MHNLWWTTANIQYFHNKYYSVQKLHLVTGTVKNLVNEVLFKLDH